MNYLIPAGDCLFMAKIPNAVFAVLGMFESRTLNG